MGHTVISIRIRINSWKFYEERKANGSVFQHQSGPSPYPRWRRAHPEEFTGPGGSLISQSLHSISFIPWNEKSFASLGFAVAAAAPEWVTFNILEVKWVVVHCHCGKNDSTTANCSESANVFHIVSRPFPPFHLVLFGFAVYFGCERLFRSSVCVPSIFSFRSRYFRHSGATDFNLYSLDLFASFVLSLCLFPTLI